MFFVRARAPVTRSTGQAAVGLGAAHLRHRWRDSPTTDTLLRDHCAPGKGWQYARYSVCYGRSTSRTTRTYVCTCWKGLHRASRGSSELSTLRLDQLFIPTSSWFFSSHRILSFFIFKVPEIHPDDYLTLWTIKIKKCLKMRFCRNILIIIFNILYCISMYQICLFYLLTHWIFDYWVHSIYWYARTESFVRSFIR